MKFVYTAVAVFAVVLVCLYAPVFSKENELQNVKAAEGKLTLLVSCCKSVCGTVGGDRYEKIELYKTSDNKYQLHIFEKHVAEPQETHKFCDADEEFAEQVMDTVKDKKFYKCIGKEGEPLCGGGYTLQFINKGRLVTVTADNFDSNDRKAFSELSSMMYSCFDERSSEDR